jgi:SM-20-related protein
MATNWGLFMAMTLPLGHVSDDDISQIMTDLCESGYSVFDNALSPDDIEQLCLYAEVSLEVGNFRAAAIGKDHNKSTHPEIRGDFSLWIENYNEVPSLKQFHDLVLRIMACAKKELFIPAKRFESHFAVYPVGAGYLPHYDQHQGANTRQLSIVLYLSDLNPGDGGELKLHNTLTTSSANIIVTPERGKLVIFVSEKILHEVLPTKKKRWSLTGWIRSDD